MANTREDILAVLASAGITDKTVDDVIAEFQATDALAQYVVGADNAEEAVLAHIPDYLTLMGVSSLAANTAPVDPTQTVKAGAGATMPAAVTDAQMNAIIAQQNMTHAERQLMTAQASIVAVLGDKPYPGEYMGNVGKLPVKGEIEKIIENLKTQYQPSGDLQALLSKTDSWFIPSNAQLDQLKVLHAAKASSKPSKNAKPKADPAWVGFDNETAYNNILNKLTSGDGTFDVMIAPKEDTGVGAEKEKAWRWGTKGFVVKYPEAGAGEAVMKEHDMTKKQLEGFLMTQTIGYVNPATPDGLSAKVRFISTKSADASGTAATEKKPGLSIRGNSPANHPDVRFIKEVGNGQTKMTCRSKMFYFAVRVNKHGEWSVRKQRLPLLWEQAPAFETLSKYATLFPASADGSKRITATDLKQMQAAQAAFVQQVMSDRSAAGEYNLQGLLDQIEERINQTAATAAARVAI